MTEKLLVVFPHPDDESFGCAGIIAKHIKEGGEVTYACGTLGEMGRNMGSPIFATRESLPLVREVELKEACEALGIQKLRKLGLHDKTIEFESIETLSDMLLKVIKEEQPTKILTHYPNYAVHPDHNALGAATIRAVQKLPKVGRPTVIAHAFSRNHEDHIGEADVVLNVTEFMDTKLAALKAHRSQTENMLKGVELQLSNNDPEALSFFATERFWVVDAEQFDLSE
ncbi:bacillithiol biosynthesis deacetylase BshB2 [Aureibacillus halotolerans]|uniref:Bacillithiol biosynthesis deacetylase BshB2 n=1 Tax=Aureibacillus halotolerans TaxID=1508390 RepID=A0A4R6U9M5_9BACI|nr:bacillithiol biosynthesis deacetylase BshB2 [Aureibacillus halotolerans]TDQ39774.1 bacillithiol biosynthesis deacetylase BshB2 [Aureibacillus halotolerans]